MRLVELGLGSLYHLTCNHSPAPSSSLLVHSPCRLTLPFASRHCPWLLVAAVYNNTQWQPALCMLLRFLNLVTARWSPMVYQSFGAGSEWSGTSEASLSTYERVIRSLCCWYSLILSLQTQFQTANLAIPSDITALITRLRLNLMTHWIPKTRN